MKAEYLVTGGAGFIGSNMVSTLVARGCGVRVLDNFSTGRRENLAADRDAIELIEGDLRDEKTLRRALKGIDPNDPDDPLLDWTYALATEPSWTVSAHLPRTDSAYLAGAGLVSMNSAMCSGSSLSCSLSAAA